jgi:hypothetical protein
MAFVRKRGDSYSLTIKWKGKSYIKALKTADEREAEQIKEDAEAQLDRIRQGKSPIAARLLADGISIVDVLFGSPEVALRLGKEPGNDNPLPLAVALISEVDSWPVKLMNDVPYAVFNAAMPVHLPGSNVPAQNCLQL